jgi:hypothetical protein
MNAISPIINKNTSVGTSRKFTSKIKFVPVITMGANSSVIIDTV